MVTRLWWPWSNCLIIVGLPNLKQSWINSEVKWNFNFYSWFKQDLLLLWHLELQNWLFFLHLQLLPWQVLMQPHLTNPCPPPCDCLFAAVRSAISVSRLSLSIVKRGAGRGSNLYKFARLAIKNLIDWVWVSRIPKVWKQSILTILLWIMYSVLEKSNNKIC